MFANKVVNNFTSQIVYELCTCKLHLWQSWVEIEHYLVAYFEHINAFKVL